MITLPHASEPAIDGGNPSGLGRGWYDFMARLTRAINGPLELRAYTVATLPASPTDGLLAYCSDASGGGAPVYSRGGVWRRLSNDAEVN